MSSGGSELFGGLQLLQNTVFSDERGEFFELFRQDRVSGFEASAFVQDNISISKAGVLRGLHYQYPYPQGKLVSVLAGEIFDVAADIRPDSPTFRRWFGTRLSQRDHNQLYVPPGFAHGFAVMSESATVLYKCTEYYRPECDAAIRWNDPSLGIEWPVSHPILSSKDANAPLLSEVGTDRLPDHHPHLHPVS